MGDLSVLFCTEGTYPFAGGGVSTWCDILCHELRDVDFTIYAITGSPEVAHRYNPPPNARKLIHVPLWGAYEPAEQARPDLPFPVLRLRRRATTEFRIEETFVPLLRELIRGINDERSDPDAGGRVLRDLWNYFRDYDWKRSWKSRQAWRAFVEEALRPFEERPEDFFAGELPSVYDLTVAMRWLYAYLLPLYADLPQVDLVHSTIASFAGIPGIVAKHEWGTPYLVTEHGVSIRERYIAVSAADFTPFAKRFLLMLSAHLARLNYHHADAVLPVANFNRRWEVPYGAAPDKIKTIYNGIDPRAFAPRPKPERSTGRPVAVAAARVFPLKDIETMIRSADVARATIPDIRYVVYGSLDADVPYVKRCRELIAELKLEETFEFGGLHEKPTELYTEGEISVLSSISEGFPYTVLESMSCARPVAATDVGGVREALEGFGVVVPPRDPQALGAAVVTLLSDDELRRSLGRQAREEVLAKYRISSCVESYAAVYERLTP